MSQSPLPRLLRSLTGEPLAIERRTLDAFLMMLRTRHLDGLSFSGAEIHAELGIATPRPGRTAAVEERNIAVIPIVGAIANRGMSLGVGALQVAAAVRSAAADRRVDGIVLDIDSPGGTVTGVPEAAAEIFAARQMKPVTAVSNGLMASAAYWIGAAAGEVVASPSSETGSIGVFSLHEDWSKWLEQEGIVITEIAAGKYKTEGAPWKALDEAGETFWRSRVAEVYDWFTGDVARFRGDTQANVKAGYGEARVLSAKAAVAAGLADRVGTLDEELVRMAEGISPRRGARADLVSLEVERRRRARARGAA
jgi:signal peptide peptidase SppA